MLEAKIYTEGKTDQKYLLKAMERLKISFDFEFYDKEYTNGISDLLNICEILSKIDLPNPQIFIFDNDCPQYSNKISVKNKSFKYWGKNVYSFAIPIPLNRINMTDNICMEYYFTDAEIKTFDKMGRRMYLSSEFDIKSGKLIKNSNISIGNKNKLKDPSNPINIKIIDSDVNDENGNLALSKNDFSNYILNDIPPFNNFNYENYRQIFSIINEIIKDFNTRKPEPIKDYEVRDILKDHPPLIDIFVGRKEIIKQLKDPLIRVVAITGLGGEGKSSLAAKFYKSCIDGIRDIKYAKYAWSDYKDSKTPFHDKLLSILEHLTDGKQSMAMYADENPNDTIIRFINFLNHNESIVVFDNVDAFVDKDTRQLTGQFKFLFDSLTTSLSKSYVIFTCRASIDDHHITFLEIPLKGLDYEEALDLAEKFNISAELKKTGHLINIHRRTNGHALWLNLIFGQIRNKRIPVYELNSIVTDQTDILDKRLLNSIWETLNSKEKEIISIISTFTRPPNLHKIEKASSIKYNKCKRVLESLLRMRFIIVVDKEGEQHFDLHPIIRLKAKEDLKPAKRKGLITSVINVLCYNDFGKIVSISSIIETYKPNIDNYIECAEIAIENKDYNLALNYVNLLSEPLLRYGDDSKFIELCENIFNEIDYDVYEIGINSDLTDIYEEYIETLERQGEFVKVNNCLESLLKTIKTIKQFIFYVRLRGYYLWFVNDFEKAYSFIKEGIDKIIEKNESIPSDILHTQALVMRDKGLFKEALQYFLGITNIESIDNWNPLKGEDLSANVGNIGRCYFLLKEYETSLKYCNKSVQYLQNESGRYSKVNYGYGLLWMADNLVKLKRFSEATNCVRKAFEVWEMYCPSRLDKIKHHIKNYPKTVLDKLPEHD